MKRLLGLLGVLLFLYGCGSGNCNFSGSSFDSGRVPVPTPPPAPVTEDIGIRFAASFRDAVNLPISRAQLVVVSGNIKAVSLGETDADGNVECSFRAAKGEVITLGFEEPYIAEQFTFTAGLNADSADGGVYGYRKDFSGYLPFNALVDIVGCVSTLSDGFGYSPYGMCASHDGATVYIAVRTSHVIKKIDVASGAVSDVAGTGASGFLDGPGDQAKFNEIWGMAISSDDGVLYVSDNGNNRIRKIALGATPAASTVSTVAGTGASGFLDGPGDQAKFNAPYGICLAENDSVLYVADWSNNRIRKIALGATPAASAVSTVAGTGASGFLDGPGDQAKFYSIAGIAASADGSVLYACGANGRIRKIVPGASQGLTVVSTVAGEGYASPQVDGTGDVARFNYMRALCLTADGKVLYVSDTDNHCIRRVVLGDTPQETMVSTIAGSFGGREDGTGISAKFNMPRGISLSAGNSVLYVLDSDNSALRRITAVKQ